MADPGEEEEEAGPEGEEAGADLKEEVEGLMDREAAELRRTGARERSNDVATSNSS